MSFPSYSRISLNFAIVAIATTVIATAGTPAVSFAEKADKTKPTNIEADRLVHDDIQQISTYTGRVILTKGTILMKGDKLVIRQDPEGYQYGIMTGKLASFRQKRELPDQYIEGYGLEINYDGKTEIVRFIDRAYVRRLDKEVPTDEIQGSIVIYEARSENYAVEGSGGKAPDASNPSGRVKVTIQPKSAEAASTSAAASSNAAGSTKPSPKPTAKPTTTSTIDLKSSSTLSLPAAKP